jgi:hypothetical protein
VNRRLRSARPVGFPLAALVLACGTGAFGCGVKELPPRLPSTAIHDRIASRIGLVDFVIADAERARKVRALYAEIERSMLAAQSVEARELEKLGAGCLDAERELGAAVAASRAAELTALANYARLQLAIRALTTPQEFARLDAVR